MSSFDHSLIRQRLVTQQQGSAPESEETEPLWNEARSPELPLPSEPDRQLSLSQAAMTQALRQRSRQEALPQHPEVDPSLTLDNIPPEIQKYLARLEEEAGQVNELARQHQYAIEKFQRTVNALGLALIRNPSYRGIQLHDVCVMRDAAVTAVIIDDAGRYIVEAENLDLQQDLRDASQTAQDLRSFERYRSQNTAANSHRFGTLFAEPVATLETLWYGLTTNLGTRSRITPVEILVWFGGGLIGRLALQLLVSAFPATFPWLVGATIATVVLTLYRFLSSNRPDLSSLTRLFLALVGLIVGGQL